MDLISPITNLALKSAPGTNTFFNLIDEYDRKQYKPELPFSGSDKLNSAFRASRYIGENNIICEVIITTGTFYEEGYEFFPKTYINRTCIDTNIDPFVSHSHRVIKPEVCLHNDNQFGCQTNYEDLYVFKKSTNGSKQCWEHFTQVVAVGCKCNIRFQY